MRVFAAFLFYVTVNLILFGLTKQDMQNCDGHFSQFLDILQTKQLMEKIIRRLIDNKYIYSKIKSTCNNSDLNVLNISRALI